MPKKSQINDYSDGSLKSQCLLTWSDTANVVIQIMCGGQKEVEAEEFKVPNTVLSHPYC